MAENLKNRNNAAGGANYVGYEDEEDNFWEKMKIK